MALYPLLDKILGAIAILYSAIELMVGPVVASALFFIAGIYVYALIYEMFFERLSKREIFKIELTPEKLEYSFTNFSFGQIFRFLLKNIFLFPIMATVITVFTVLLLILLSKDQPVQTIASISVAIVMTVRILAYTNEKLAKEVSKMLPFALLTIILTNPTSFVQSQMVGRMDQLFEASNSLIPLFLAFIAIEIIIQPLLQMHRLSNHVLPQFSKKIQGEKPNKKKLREAEGEQGDDEV